MQQADNASLMDYIKAWPQYLLPHYVLSGFMYTLTRSRVRWWKNWFTAWFIKRFNINMDEAQISDPKAYASFNEFFTRALKADARPLLAGPEQIACPVDGAISQFGRIDTGKVFQAKGRDFDVTELLGGDPDWSKAFQNGQFATIYLSPKDYHRIHMPLSGRLRRMIHIPGRLFSVNPATTRAVPRLFARNERVVALFETACGPMAMVLVGAIFVASMETTWHGLISPPHAKKPQQWDYQDITLEQGEEMGRFNMGSTVILLFPDNSISWNSIQAAQGVKLGEILGQIEHPA